LIDRLLIYLSSPGDLPLARLDHSDFQYDSGHGTHQTRFEVNNIDIDTEIDKLVPIWDFSHVRHLQANAGTMVATS